MVFFFFWGKLCWHNGTLWLKFYPPPGKKDCRKGPSEKA